MQRLLTWLGLFSPDGRRAWAFLALLGASGVMTAFAALAMWWLRTKAAYTFWLGLAAHGQIAVCLTGFMAMFIKRSLDLETKAGSIRIKDQADAPPPANIKASVEVDLPRSSSAGATGGDNSGAEPRP